MSPADGQCAFRHLEIPALLGATDRFELSLARLEDVWLSRADVNSIYQERLGGSEVSPVTLCA